MPGTLFLDALEKKAKLKKGYPMKGGRVLEPDWVTGEPIDEDLYGAGPVKKAFQRLVEKGREALKGEVDPNKPNYKNVLARRTAEESEGLIRNEHDITNLGVRTEKELQEKKKGGSK